MNPQGSEFEDGIDPAKREGNEATSHSRDEDEYFSRIASSELPASAHEYGNRSFAPSTSNPTVQLAREIHSLSGRIVGARDKEDAKRSAAQLEQTVRARAPGEAARELDRTRTWTRLAQALESRDEFSLGEILLRIGITVSFSAAGGVVGAVVVHELITKELAKTAVATMITAVGIEISSLAADRARSKSQPDSAPHHPAALQAPTGWKDPDADDDHRSSRPGGLTP